MNVLTPNKRLPVVAIVIVAFEDWAVLEKCLASIESSTYKYYRVMVVDNSLSNTIEQNLSKKQNLYYYKAARNLGFSRGCNLGIAQSLESDADYTLLLNPDTELEVDCLSELIRCAENFQDTGIVGGKILYTSLPDRIWYAGGKLSYLEGVGKHFKKSDRSGSLDVQEVTYATGCCMLIPNAVFGITGPLKESIFMYLDDAEFCMRIQKEGYKIYYNPKAILRHAVGPGGDRRQFPAYYLYFSIRNKPLVAQGFAYAFYLHVLALILATTKLALYGFSFGVSSRREKLRAIVLGAWDSLSLELREKRRFPRLFEKTNSSIG